MKIECFNPNVRFLSNMYLIYSGNEAAIIDPSLKYEQAKDLIEEAKLNIKYIFVTHAHFDHILEIDDWVEKTDAKVIVGYDDSSALSDPKLNCYWRFVRKENGYRGSFTTVDDGDKIFLSDEEIEIISTPGHTKGSITLKLDNSLFVGDLIFSEGNYGRYDLPGGDVYTLALSISKVCDMNDNFTVYPGHGRKTTIKEYKKYRRI